MKKAALKKIDLKLATAPVSKVSVAGTFNNWEHGKNPIKDNAGSGLYKSVALKNVEFQLATAPGSKVSVAGTFNNWDPEKNPMKDNAGSGLYKTAIAMAPGKHAYKFVVNGEWRVDPNCSESVPNGHGSLNSVISVPA